MIIISFIEKRANMSETKLNTITNLFEGNEIGVFRIVKRKITILV